ncbi:hypothetical protein [Glaciihabitans sp. dw_435]|uniref:hypothetical protein n=1 Tax=Glaciihabitans sp. dw_435 TaxID=2720081 RepID=UPI001BD30794|nr:hypothetical protein [Glaciihabitans sp. dw_435]
MAETRTRPGVLAPILTILAGIVGAGLLYIALAVGVGVALSGNGSGADGYVIMFIAGGLLVLGTIVAGLFGLLRSGRRVLWGIALGIGLVPLAVIVLLVIDGRG